MRRTKNGTGNDLQFNVAGRFKQNCLLLGESFGGYHAKYINL